MTRYSVSERHPPKAAVDRQLILKANDRLHRDAVLAVAACRTDKRAAVERDEVDRRDVKTDCSQGRPERRNAEVGGMLAEYGVVLQVPVQHQHIRALDDDPAARP